MNQFFYETRGREKVRELMQEGMRSQSCRRCGISKAALLHGFPRTALIILGILNALELLTR